MDVNFKPTPKLNYQRLPEPVKEIAENLEADFAKNLIQEMQKTVNKDEADSGPMAFYNDLMNDERAKIISKDERGLGLKEIIIKQLYPQAYAQIRMPVKGESNEQ